MKTCVFDNIYIECPEIDTYLKTVNIKRTDSYRQVSNEIIII